MWNIQKNIILFIIRDGLYNINIILSINICGNSTINFTQRIGILSNYL